VTDDERAELEAERDFLLRSIDDLEREREVGDVSDDDYRSLVDGYTARAADVIRRIDAVSVPVRAQPTSRRRVTFAWMTLVVAVAVASGLLVARSTGERLPGQVPTGNVENDSVSGLLASARARLDPTAPQAAIDLYGEVLQVEPDNAEALTYLGWLSVLSARGVDDDAEASRLVQSGMLLMRQATTVDDSYADPHCLLGISFARFVGDDDAALESFDRCVALDPPAETRRLVEPIIAELRDGQPPTT
jgi:hypothetical protein